MATPQRSVPKVGQTTQEMQNQGFDEKYNVPVAEMLVENEAQNALLRWPANSSGVPKVALDQDVTLNAGDIEIGAVEIKDGDTDTRLDVESDGTKNAAYVQMNKALPPGTNLIGDVKVSSQSLTKKTVTASSSGNNTIHTPAAGSKIRLYFFGYSAGSNVTGVVTSLKFASGGTVFDRQYLVAPGQPYARNIQAGKRYVDGAIDEALILNLDVAETVYCNVELEEI
jgi:hypothetical protein